MSVDVDTMEFEPFDGSGSANDRSRRRQVAVGVVAAMLVAGAGGVGYGLGRNFDDSPGAALPQTSQEDAPVGTDGAVPTSVSPAPSGTQAPVDKAASTSGGVASDMTSSSGGWGYGPFGSQPSEVLFERTLANGMTLRAQLGQTWDNSVGDDMSGGWAPAPWCYESGQLRVALAGNGVIDVGGTSWFEEPFKGRSISSVLLGGADSQPHWVVAVQAPPDSSNVSVTFTDGATDSVAPQNGIALLAVPAATMPPPDNGAYEGAVPPEFDVAFDGGAEPAVVTSAGLGMWDDPEFQESCTPPPPALPEPGEQPADPVSAEAAIVDAMTRLYDGSADGELELVDDETGIADARVQVREGGFASQADSAQAVVEELVFTAPTEAWFRYRVDTDSVGLTDRFGIARIVDGTWRITRDTICQDLAMAGGDCGDGWQPIFPPGSEPGMFPAMPIDESGIGD